MSVCLSSPMARCTHGSAQVGMGRSARHCSADFLASAFRVTRRGYHGFHFASMYGWKLPYGSQNTKVTREELERMRYFTQKPRSKWDYHRVEQNIDSQSEFRKTEGRESFFQGMREDNSTLKHGSLHTPRKYRLYEHFDEYTKPGVNTKLAAAFAVKEQWDAEEFYYPGEAWRRNRPGFRSVPKELLNRQTWYHWSETITQWHKIQPTMRTRSWNPDWPPPGYKVPTMEGKKEFLFGVEEEGLMSEVERYNWYRSWSDNNMRCGWLETPLFVLLGVVLYLLARNAFSTSAYYAMMSNLYYPGRTMIRPNGVPKDWENDCFWWQKPLEEFPNQGAVWFMNQSRFAYINYIKKRDARELAFAQAEGRELADT